FSGMEDRLNPLPAEDVDERTLGGYPRVHGRSPAFEASDGSAYTVAIEVDVPERVGEPFAAYLVFVRWANSGSAIMSHLETGDLAVGQSEAEARTALEALPLSGVKEILE